MHQLTDSWLRQTALGGYIIHDTSDDADTRYKYVDLCELAPGTLPINANEIRDTREKRYKLRFKEAHEARNYQVFAGLDCKIAAIRR